MPIKGKSNPPRRRRSWLRSILRASLIVTPILLGLAIIAGVVVTQAAMGIAAQLAASLAEGIAAMASLIVAFAAVLLAMMAVVVLQTPPFLVPFAPVARVIAVAVTWAWNTRLLD